MAHDISGLNILLTRGDSYTVRFPYLEDGEEHTMEEGDVARFMVREEDGSEILINKTLTDNYVLSITPEDTQGLEIGTYRYDVEITLANGWRHTYIPDTPKGKAKFILTWEADIYE